MQIWSPQNGQSHNKSHNTPPTLEGAADTNFGRFLNAGSTIQRSEWGYLRRESRMAKAQTNGTVPHEAVVHLHPRAETGV